MTSKNKKVMADLKQQRKDARLLDAYKRQGRWVTWAGTVILILILLSIFTMGYASNWWQNPVRTSQFAPGSSTSASESNSPQPTGGSSSTSGQSSSSKESTTTSTNTTTTTNNTTTNNSSAPPSNLQTLLDETQPGDNIDSIINRADQLGVEHNCSIILVVIQECTFGVGGTTFTTKNLTADGAITGITIRF